MKSGMALKKREFTPESGTVDTYGNIVICRPAGGLKNNDTINYIPPNHSRYTVSIEPSPQPRVSLIPVQELGHAAVCPAH